MSPFETYQTYLSMKSHFTNSKYDFFKYGGKSRATVTSFNKRKDKYWFEKSSRKYSDKEIVDFLLANFVFTDNPQNLWIGEIINSGERTYADWMRRQQSLTYLFKEQSSELFSETKLEDALNCSKGHPPVLKKFLGGKICIETLCIYDKIFLFGKTFDKKLLDPVWESVSLKIKKYNPFLNIDVFSYKKILREIINE
jgi:T4 gene Gp59 loader of gp41 DNA helicase